MDDVPIVVVVGSLNIDRTYRVDRLPKPGETALALGVQEAFGGKGANQAIAAARSGARATLVGCLGLDDDGEKYARHLNREGLDPFACISVKKDTPTGTAQIVVDVTGENTIVVNPGANLALTEVDVDSALEWIASASVVMAQLECPLEVVEYAFHKARDLDVPTMLNPSPWDDRAKELLSCVDWLIVNETEAEALTGLDADALSHSKLSELKLGAVRIFVVTRGARPTLALTTDEALLAEPPIIESPVDTVGAGDAFAGAFCVAMGRGASVASALTYANAAGALATTKPGAQTGAPTRAEIEVFLEETEQ